MTLDSELSLQATNRDSTLTIGVFDGVHRGHQHLISRTIDEAKRTGRQAGVVTFSNHPKDVLFPGSEVVWLMDLEERVKLIKETGADFVAPVTFDKDVSLMPAEQFLAKLVDKLKMKQLVVGPDFVLGHDRDGSLGTLPGIGERLGVDFESVESLAAGDVPVRSTVVRGLVADGFVDVAAHMLGRHFFVKGEVVIGERRGRTIGFPTANLSPPSNIAVPGFGIYATWAHTESGKYMASTSIGVRPTFEGEGRTIEAYLLDFDDDLYGQTIRLEFVDRLRGEKKFDGIESLVAQIGRDVEQTRELLGSQ